MPISSPLDIAWDHAYWVEGPEFVSMYDVNLHGGGLVVGSMSLGGAGVTADFSFSTWPDEAGTADASGATVTWDNSHTDFNGKPVAVFPHGALLESSAYGSAISQPFELVVIGSVLNDGANDGRIFAGLNMATISEGTSGLNYDIWAGSFVSTGNILDHLPHVFDAQFDATDTLDVDGSTEASGNAGTNGWSKTSIGQGAGVSVYSTLLIAFVGVKAGLLSSGDRADLLAWSQGHYQTP